MKQFLIVVAIAVAAGTYIFASSSKAASETDPTRSAEATGTAPDFALRNLDGKTVRLSELRGKAVVLNFWATWCPPCRHEIPWFIDLQKKYGSQGLQIVGVSMDQTGPQDVAAFARATGMNYTVVMGDWNVARSYGGIRALPTTFYIARDGTVQDSVPGLISREQMEKKIIALLAGPKPKTGR